MALIKPSGLVTSFSGKLGGSILAQGKNGNYIKQNAYSQQPYTPGQSVRRTKMGLITQIWRTLSPTERASWQGEIVNYPYIDRFGDTQYYTAFQLFNKLNLNLQVANITANTTAPTFSPVALGGIDLFFPLPLNIMLEVTPTAANTTISIFMAPQSASSLIPKSSTFRQVLQTAGTGVEVYEILNSAYTDVFGALVIGNYVFCKIKVINNDTGLSTDFSDVASIQYV